MPRRARQRIPPTDDWQQLELLIETPGQRSYEVIRPVVLFGEPVPERAATTQTHARTVYRTFARRWRSMPSRTARTAGTSRRCRKSSSSSRRSGPRSPRCGSWPRATGSGSCRYRPHSRAGGDHSRPVSSWRCSPSPTDRLAAPRRSRMYWRGFRPATPPAFGAWRRSTSSGRSSPMAIPSRRAPPPPSGRSPPAWPERPSRGRRSTIRDDVRCW
jgi:hypothetical protein